MKDAQVGEGLNEPRPVGKRPEAERVWRALVEMGLGQRKAALHADVKRATVRKYFDRWMACGWTVKKQGGGLRPTDKAPENLREGWAATPQGSPLHPHESYVSGVGRPSRLHRGKLSASLERDVDLSGPQSQWWESSKPGPNGVIYSVYILPCKTDAGVVGVPVQLIQPSRLDKPLRVVIQSANAMVYEADLVAMDRGEVLAWVKEAMTGLLCSWLGDQESKLGPLKWVGLEKEDLEVAQEAMRGAKVQGDVQRDFVAVDKSRDKFKPKEWAKEEEQSLRAFLRLRHLEKEVELLRDGLDRTTGILETITRTSTEQFDQLAAIAEYLVKEKQ